MTPREQKVTQLLSDSIDVLELATKEFDVIHALCDRAEVPRLVEGAKMSASQRVAILEGAWAGLSKQIGKTQPKLQ